MHHASLARPVVARVGKKTFAVAHSPKHVEAEPPLVSPQFSGSTNASAELQRVQGELEECKRALQSEIDRNTSQSAALLEEQKRRQAVQDEIEGIKVSRQCAAAPGAARGVLPTVPLSRRK